MNAEPSRPPGVLPGADDAPKRLPPIAAILTFEAVFRLGSMEKASGELALSASAVGKRIAVLEEWLGVQLLTRRARGVTPTVAGTQYMEQVRAALDLLATATLHRKPGRRIQRLRICLPPTFARQIVAPSMARFLQQNADVELEMVLSVPYLSVRQQEADVEVLASPRHRAAGEELLAERVFPMAAPAYRDMYGLDGDMGSLARASWIRCPIEPWRPWFAAAGLTWHEPDEGPLLVDSGMALEAAASGLGVALLRPSLARRWLRCAELAILSDIGSEPSTVYSLVRAPKTEVEDAATRFADWLIDVCAQATR